MFEKFMMAWSMVYNQVDAFESEKDAMDTALGMLGIDDYDEDELDLFLNENGLSQ